MKANLLLPLLLALSLCSTCLAQKTTLGPRVGINLSTFNHAVSSFGEAAVNDPGSNPKSGLLAGAVVNVPVAGAFSLQPEVLYSQKGIDYVYADQPASERIEYLEMPLLGKFSLGEGKIRGFLTTGPSLGYLIGAKRNYEVLGREIGERFNPSDNYYKRLELGASLGGGASYQLGSHEVNLDLRYTLGLSNVYDKGVTGDKLKNRTFSISLAFLVVDL